MDTLLLRRAALLQAKLKVLEQHKDAFTDHVEIIAFHRLKKQFEGLITSHTDQIPIDPLEVIKEDFQKDKTLVSQLQSITTDAELRCSTFEGKHHDYLTPEFLQDTIEWLTAKRESLQTALTEIHSRISHQYWSDQHEELHPDAKAIAKFLAEDDLLKPGFSDWLAMSELKGPKYENLLNTLGSIEAILRKNVFYVMHADEQLGPFLLDDLDKLLATRTITDSDLAWHHSAADWLPLSELILFLESHGFRPPPSPSKVSIPGGGQNIDAPTFAATLKNATRTLLHKLRVMLHKYNLG